MCVESVCVSVYVLVCDELLSHGSPFTLCGRQAVKVTLNYCFPNPWEWMWNGYDSVNKDESVKALRHLRMTWNPLMSLLLRQWGKRHCINDSLEHVRFKDGGSDREKRWVRDGLWQLFFFLKKAVKSTSPWRTDTGGNQDVDKVSSSVLIRYIREGKLTEDQVYFAECVCVLSEEARQEIKCCISPHSLQTVF